MVDKTVSGVQAEEQWPNINQKSNGISNISNISVVASYMAGFWAPSTRQLVNSLKDILSKKIPTGLSTR